MISPVEILDTLRYDPRLQGKSDEHGIFLFTYHVDRVVATAQHFGWQAVLDRLHNDDYAQELLAAIAQATKQPPLKLRAIISRDGGIVVEATSIPEVPNLMDAFAVGRGRGGVWDVLIDNHAVSPSDYTRFKTTRRSHYNDARTRVGITSAGREVLLVNAEGEIMEGSITNVALLRNGVWTTPPASSGCLPGVCRRYLLEHGHVIEGTIRADSIRNGEKVILCNAVQGALRGVIQA